MMTRDQCMLKKESKRWKETRRGIWPT